MPRERRTAFGDVAELYDRTRPSYPERLIEDVIAMIAPDAPRRALEVGAGTGKATILFAQRGIAVHALEPLEEMAALAERNCAPYRDTTIERAEFESWENSGRAFPLLYSAQAWHWIDSQQRYEKAQTVLEPGGILAAFWNRADWETNPLRLEIDEVYREIAPELLQSNAMRTTYSSDTWGRWHDEIEAAGGLKHPEVRTYPWGIEYTSDEWTRLLRTHSDHIVLDPGQAQQLYERITAIIDAHGGILPITYLTRLCLAKRESP